VTLFPRPNADLRRSLDGLLSLIDQVFPLQARHKAGLTNDVRDLSRSLTSERSDRDAGYLGKPGALSAYLRYYLPWNVYRLARLLPALSLNLKDGDLVTDLGSGPLTVPIALWLSRPDLRSLKLEFQCLDRTAKVLDAGTLLFAALVAGTGTPWQVRAVRGTLGTRLQGGAALVCAANVFNESAGDARLPLAVQAEKRARLLSALAREDGAVLVVEPGVPASGAFVSALRDALIDDGRLPLAPCPHAGTCPMPGGRHLRKWCHFVFDTDDAPDHLHKLSAAAGIPKERATLSFLFAGGLDARGLAGGVSGDKAGADGALAAGGLASGAGGGLAGRDAKAPLKVRVVSDSFPLPDGSSGRYACSARGLALLVGSRSEMTALGSGCLVETRPQDGPEHRDPKTDALVVRP